MTHTYIYGYLLTILLLVISISNNAQIKVKNDNSVEIGNHSNTISYLNLHSTGKTRGLNTSVHLNNSGNEIYNSLYWSASNGIIVGTENYFQNQSKQPYRVDGLRNRIYSNTSNQLTGLYNLIRANSNNSYGIQNYMTGTLASNNYGIWNQISTTANQTYGIYSHMNTNANFAKGIYNYLQASGSSINASSMGMHNHVDQNNMATTYGVYNYMNGSTTGSSSSKSYGLYNQIYAPGNGDYSGVKSSISVYNTHSTRKIAGVSATINGSGSAQYVRAVEGIIYSVSSPQIWAGYFSGGQGVYVNGQTINSSDQSIKKDIAGISKALDKVKKLKPKKYKFKNDKKDAKDKYGFLAQDVQTVLADLVYEVMQPGTLKEVEISPERRYTDSEGNEVVEPAITQMVEQDDGETLLALDYQGFIPIIVGAIQEQQTEIDDIKKNKIKAEDDHADRILDLERNLRIQSFYYKL